MLYIYRSKASSGARDLTENITLRGVLARRTKGLALRNLQRDDIVVCWGSVFQNAAGVRTLNNGELLSKFEEAQKLAEAGVSTVKVSRTRPAAAQARPVVRAPYNVAGGLLDEAALRRLVQDVNNYLAQPLPPPQPAEEWLPRRNNHVGGVDLLNGVDHPDYFSKKENIVEEYRLHMFLGKSIRAGKKVKRPTRPDGRTPSHEWIRSFDAGWVIQYDGFSSTKDMRAIAAKALKALGLDFGAVDLGKKADGSLIVLEVNRAPGIENNTVESYATHIIDWVRNPQAPATQE